MADKNQNESIYWFIVINASAKSLATESIKLRKEVEEFGRIIAASLITMKGERRY